MNWAKLLCLDPSKRFDADLALNHDFFWTDPIPCSLENMLLNKSWEKCFSIILLISKIKCEKAKSAITSDLLICILYFLPISDVKNYLYKIKWRLIKQTIRWKPAGVKIRSERGIIHSKYFRPVVRQ